MYMGRTRTFECPHCGADVYVQVDATPADENLAQCQDCENIFYYDEDEMEAWA